MVAYQCGSNDDHNNIGKNAMYMKFAWRRCDGSLASFITQSPGLLAYFIHLLTSKFTQLVRMVAIHHHHPTTCYDM